MVSMLTITVADMSVAVCTRRMQTVHGVHYAHVVHMQITWYCLYIIYSWSQFPAQYCRLSQQCLGFVWFSPTLWSLLLLTSMRYT